MNCPRCGTVMEGGICPECGFPITARKKIRKFFSVGLVLVMVLLTFCACGKSVDDNEKPKNKTSLLDKGNEIVALLEEMVKSEDYVSIMFGSSSVEDVINKLAEGDYSKPKAVYEIKCAETNVDLLVSMADGNPENMSKELKNLLAGRMFGSMLSMINGKYGAEYLAATSVLTAGKTFIANDVEANTIYVYVFKTGYPIMISYVKGEDGIVSASGGFVCEKELINGTKDDVSALFRDAGIVSIIGAFEIEEVK